jgi:ATP/ADP translocase/HEAT repeat protein
MNRLSPGTPGLVRRVLRPVVDLRDGESTTAAAMFAYSFLAMTAYNIIKPITRSRFISNLGADNLPWVQLVAGLLIGLIMHGYAHALRSIPRRWAVPATLAACVGLLLVFWALFTAGYDAASVAFYVLGLILGVLLISQFWTLANDIYDARHAKRLFGFIGGGASLGGATGAAITAATVSRVGTVNLLLVGAAVLGLCLALVLFVLHQEQRAGTSEASLEAEGVGGAEAIRLLRESRHLQLIAAMIGCAAMGAVIVEQQLNMAAEARMGQDAEGITQFLAQVTVYLSLAGFLVQVMLTSRIHTMLGIGFAMLILPIGLGTTAVVMLFNAGLWAPAFARVFDSSLRYTVDKTTREILFLPLPVSLKYRAKPFVDVTMDRFAKGVGALTLLVCIKPWGLALTWQQLSFVSLTLMGAWIWLAERARREYLGTFRRSLAHGDVAVAELRTPHADLQTIELLVEELAHTDERRVLYAIDLLESLDKRHLITPLLLHHASALVRARALQAVEELQQERAVRWLPAVERLLADEDAGVRAAAVCAIFSIQGTEATTLLRQHLNDGDPRLVAAAGATLMASGVARDVEAARTALDRLAGDTRESGVAGRLAVARSLGDVPHDACCELLVPLLFDKNVEVAREAIRSAGRLGPHSLFVAPLVSFLRHRLLKNEARTVLVGYGEPVVEVLAHFLRDPTEDPWVRRHLPATLVHLPTQRTLDLLTDRLADVDGFLRYKAISAMEILHQSHPELVIRRDAVEALALTESLRYFNALTLHANLVLESSFGADTLLVRALEDKQRRSLDRVFRLLVLLYPHADMRLAKYALDHGDAARRARAAEYLDNVLGGTLRRRVVLMIDEMAPHERVRRTNVLFRTRPRSPDDTLAQLIHDDDPIIAACAIHVAAERGLQLLTDDIEFALTRRDPPDAYVEDAARWALDVLRTAGDGQQGRWLQPFPIVELTNRLRHLPLFNYVSVDELFRIVGAARQIRYERGRVVYDADEVPDSLQFLIDGECRRSDGTILAAPSPLSFEELLARRPVEQAIHAVDVAVTLAVTYDEFLTVLSDNIDVVQGLFRMVMDTRDGMGWHSVTAGVPPELAAPLSGDGLGPMERALLLQASPLWGGATGPQLLRLGTIAGEVPLEPGAVIAREGDDPAIYVVIRGALRLEPGPGATGRLPLLAGPGHAIGVYETLANLPVEARAVVSASGVALRIDGRDLFDLLASDVELLQGLFGVFFTRDANRFVLDSARPFPVSVV